MYRRVLDGIATSYGSMTSFATILTQHGETLHNHDHSHILEPGRMMLTDAGAERVTNYFSRPYTYRTCGRQI